MAHPVFLRRDSWIQSEHSIYQTPTPPNDRPAFRLMCDVSVGPHPPHPVVARTIKVFRSLEPQSLSVALVRRFRIPDLTTHYLVKLLPLIILANATIFVSDGYRHIPFAGVDGLEAGELIPATSAGLFPLPY